jgi:hypothetical protein
MNDRIDPRACGREARPRKELTMAMRTIALSILLPAVAFGILPVWAGAPSLISYQGRLTEIAGGPISATTELRFRIYLGGDDVSLVSSGLRVYDETATVIPSDKGIFSHMIGAGVPAAGCDDGPCELSPQDFGDGTTPVWIEVRLDPDGIPDNPDDELLLPRTRVGTVGFAYRVASLDGAEGGVLSGPVVADSLTARGGATLGDGATFDVALNFDGPDSDAALTWLDDIGEFLISAETRHEMGLSIPPQRAIAIGPFSNPTPDAYIRYYHTNLTFADGNLDGAPDQDHVVGVCYNCREGATGGVDLPDEYTMKAQWEMTYAPADGTRVVEHNWNFLSPGQSLYRPLLFYMDTDRAGGYANPTASWTFQTDRSRVGLHINQNGHVMIGGDSPQPRYDLEVLGDARVNGNLLMGECDDVTAASSIWPGECNMVRLNGAATVEDLNHCGSSRRGRLLYVICGDEPTVLCDGDGVRCNGGNMRLEGDDADFVCTPDDMVTLLCDGTHWRQVAVSRN